MYYLSYRCIVVSNTLLAYLRSWLEIYVYRGLKLSQTITVNSPLMTRRLPRDGEQ